MHTGVDEYEKAGESYFKLRNFLRAVPARYDSEYGYIPKDVGVYDQYRTLRGDWEKPTGPFRKSTYCNSEQAAIILWMPGNTQFEKPTFRQFLDAYDLYRINGQ